MTEVKVKFRILPILSPLGEMRVKVTEPVRRLLTIEGKVIGLLDANKPYGDVVMGVIKAYLKSKGVRSFISEVKPVVTMVTPERIIQKLAKTDAVVLSFADCGSCSTALAMDQVRLEKMGIPTVAVVTDYFASHYARIAANMGLPDAPIVVVEHPLGDGATREMAEEKANKIVKDIVKALTLPMDELKEKYGARRWIELRGEI